MPKGIEVVWKDGQRGSWCQAIVDWLTQGFIHRMDTVEDRVRGDGAIVVVKADQIGEMEELNRYLESLKWLLLIVTANEDVTWHGQRFHHPNSLVWLQTPHKHQHAHRFLPWGWTPGCSVEVQAKKTLDFSFSGQATHARRWECLEALRSSGMTKYNYTIGPASNHFGGGLPQEDYYRIVAASKVIPCPSGPVTVDSLRVCEALQLGAVPVLDTVSPTGADPEYWQRVFPGHPFEVISEWRTFPFQLEHILKNWEMVSETVSWYWRKYKAGLQAKLMLDLHDLGAM